MSTHCLLCFISQSGFLPETPVEVLLSKGEQFDTSGTSCRPYFQKFQIQAVSVRLEWVPETAGLRDHRYYNARHQNDLSRGPERLGIKIYNGLPPTVRGLSQATKYEELKKTDVSIPVTVLKCLN